MRTYLESLPVPEDGFESQALLVKYDETFSAENDPYSITYVYNQVMAKNPVLRQIILDDLKEACDKQRAFINCSDVLEFSNGIQAGYQFLVGNVMYLKFLRSGHADFTDFLLSSDNDFYLTSRDSRRIREVRTGKAWVDMTTDKIKSSGDLAENDTMEYFMWAPFLADAFNAELGKIASRMAGESQTAIGSFFIGFHHGTEQAVEMFIQLEEEHLLTRARYGG